ncbi:MAG: N-acetylmuramoyl-L-alanine amidase [Bacteroidetes bacterium]|nr:N-acetylmuramoyl-L-alanine amidase [Bacteroidota bacterium]
MRPFLVSIVVLFALVASAQAQLLHDMIHAEIELNPPEVAVAGKIATTRIVGQELSAPFTGIAMQGFTASDSLSGAVRFFENNTWGPWHPLYIVRSGTDEAFLAAYRGDMVRTASSLELQFQIDSAHELQILIAGTFDQRLDGQDTPSQQSQKTGQSNDFLITAPHLRRRAEWGAQPFRGTPIALNRPSYNYMTLHHTAGFSARTLVEGLDQVRRIQDFHQNGRGWSDIGYQFLMDQEGRLYQGRPFLNEAVPFDQGPPLAHGAHAGGANTGNIGISLMGCYHPPEGSNCLDQMTEPAVDSLIATFGFLSERYGVSPKNMRGHRDFGSTACPGDNNYRMLPGFILRVEGLLVTGNNLLGRAAMDARVDNEGIVTVKWVFTADFGIAEFIVRRRVGDDSTVRITSGAGAVDGRVIDTPGVGRHVYELWARNESGIEQRLALAGIDVEAAVGDFLTQSFPNPTSGQTTIRYFLARESGITFIEVFDVTGKRMLTGEKQYREAGEWYVTHLNTSDLPSGVYFYRILVDGFGGTVFEATQSLIVIR